MASTSVDKVFFFFSPQVVFTHEVTAFADIKTRNMTYERRYAIFFENDEVMGAYDLLLEHACQTCEEHPTFRTFVQLKDHMRKKHERFYCELCVENLKVLGVVAVRVLFIRF